MALINNINLSDPFMKALKAVNSVSGDSTTLTPEDLKKQRTNMERASKLATPTAGIETESFDIGEIECEWVRPTFAHNKDVIIMYAHGGGYTCGGLSYARILASKLALAAGLSVVSFKYRLAPENKYPGALEDAEMVWNYLMGQGFGAKNVILAGDSAGGNLMLCLTQKIIEQGRISPKALLLFSPWTDMTATSETYEKCKGDDPILTYNYIISVRDAYIGADADPADPAYSPLFGSFENFPPVLVQVGKHELLMDDSVSLAKKIQKAGGQATLMQYADGWHVFQQMPIPLATRAMEDVGAYVAKLLYNH